MTPHAPGHTLPADAFFEPSQFVGFSVAHPTSAVFMHFHDFYELGLVTEGTGLHMTPTAEQRVSRGSVIFVAPGASHGYRMSDGLVVYHCFLRVETVQFELPWTYHDKWLGQLFTPPGIEPPPPAVLSLDEEALAECLAHLEAIRERPADRRSEAFDLGHLLLALDVLARYVERDQPERLTGEAGASMLVSRAVELMDHDLTQRWTLDDLAGQLFVSPFHLGRQFNRWMGLPPIAWLGRRRAERAAILLATTDSAIGAIGGQVGWPDPSHFSRRFRQHMGVSPRTYRAQRRSCGFHQPDRDEVDRARAEAPESGGRSAGSARYA